MNPFNHTDTIQASIATAEAVHPRGHTHRLLSAFNAPEIGESFVYPNNFVQTSPKDTDMTTIYTGHVFDTSDASELWYDGPVDHDFALEETSNRNSDTELFLVGRPVLEVSTPSSLEADDEHASRAAKRLKNAEKLADETGEVRIGDEDELRGVSFGTLDALAGSHASEDVLETIDGEINLGLSILERADADSYLSLTMDDSSCLELALRNANGWKLLAFSKAVQDFSAYDLQAHPEMQVVSERLNSTGRLLDSQGFEAIVWEDIHVSAFVRHCVNVAQALKFDLYFDKRAQKQCNRLTVKRAPGVTNKVIVAASLIADKTPEVILGSSVRLTGVYAYEAPIVVPSAAQVQVKAVEAVKPAKTIQVKATPAPTAKPANQQVKAVKKEQPVKKGSGVKHGRMADGTKVVYLPDVHVPAHGTRMRKEVKAFLASQPEPAPILVGDDRDMEVLKGLRPRLSEGDELLTKVVRFAKFGVIVQDALGNEGFLGFRETDAAKRGGVDHDRLVVKVADEVKVKVVTVGANGFVKTTLLCVVDPISHYLSCLQIGVVQLGVVMRRRSEHCFYVTLGGAIDGILAVRDIPNLADVKDKLRADTRLNACVTSVNAEKRNFHIAIESFSSTSKEATN